MRFSSGIMGDSRNTGDHGGFPPPVPFSKRFFDTAFAAMALVFFAPFMLLVAGIILVTEGRPIFFAQERIGHGGKVFRCLKFRTMVCDADVQLRKLLASDPEARAEWEETRKLTNDPRISAIGHILRKSSLDELPQFLNVLRGEMSVVGPRPIVAEEAEKYREHFIDYKAVRPGITGSWQVSGRSDTTYAERVAMDVDYVANRSFWLDVKITVQTVTAVLFQTGAR